MTDAEIEVTIDAWMKEYPSLCWCASCRSEYIGLAKMVRDAAASEAIKKLRIYSCGCARRLAEHFRVEP